eukprot:scaffold49857_cov71-Cyclotella_meneghiniana.AAC.11
MERKSHYALGLYAVVPILSDSDFYKLVRATSEANEHTYGMLRQILREFTVEQLIYLVNKATLEECVKIVKEVSTKMPKGGPIEVDLSSPAVNKLWDNVRRIMNTTSSFGVRSGGRK